MKLSAFVAVVALAFVVIGGITYAANEKYEKSYTVRNILSDYQFVVDGDVTVDCHAVGAMAIGGNAKVSSFGDGAIAPSYFRNLISYGNYSKAQYLKDLKDYKRL